MKTEPCPLVCKCSVVQVALERAKSCMEASVCDDTSPVTSGMDHNKLVGAVEHLITAVAWLTGNNKPTN